MDKYIVLPNSNVDLRKISTEEYLAFKGTKEQAIELTKQMNLELDKLQKIQNAEKEHKILIIFQGLDASGKDGAIRNVFSSVNPSGVYVAHFGPIKQAIN